MPSSTQQLVSPLSGGTKAREGTEWTGHSLRVLFYLSSRCESHTPPVIICLSPNLIVILGSVVFERSPS